MSYDKVNDFEDVQADVLTTDTSSNAKISKLKQLKTETKVPTKAINATYEQLGNAQASAADALQRVMALETASGGNGGEVQQVDTSDLKVMLSQLLREVKSWGGYARGGTRLGKRVELDVIDITEVNSLLPTTIVDVQLANSAPVDTVNVYWDVDILHDAGEHVLTARLEQGYFTSTPLTCTVRVTRDVERVVEEEEQITVVKPVRVYGMILAKEGGAGGTWVRVNENLEPVDFDPTLHGTWAGIKTVTEYDDVMVEIPTTWVKTETFTDGQYAGRTCYWIADGEVEGFHVHPAFMRTDGTPGKLQIGAYIASMGTDSLPASVDKGGTGYDLWFHVTYNQLRSLVLTKNPVATAGWRAYSIYDHHFLARMMLTEFGTGNVQTQSMNGVSLGGPNRINYHGIWDPFGLNVNNDQQHYLIMLDGFLITGSNSLYLLDPNGSGTMIDTGVTRSYTDSGYVVRCLTQKVNGVDFGDVFIGSAFADHAHSTFADCQFTNSGSQASMVCWRPGTDYGAFFLKPLEPGVHTGTNGFRISRVVPRD